MTTPGSPPRERPEVGDTTDPTGSGEKSRRERRRLRRELAKSERAQDRARRLEDDAQPAPAQSVRSDLAEQLRGLLRAAHPRQALLTALAVALTTYVAGTADSRTLTEVAFAGVAVLAVQAVLGLLDDVADAETDAHTGRARKPVAEGHLPASNARFAALCLLILAVPISLANGWAAAAYLLGYLLVALLSQTRLQRTVVSWLPWAVSYALLPAFVAYAGPGPGLHGGPPSWQVTAAAAALGVGVHFLLALPDLVADNKAGARHLPLRIALRIGATRLLVLSVIFTVAALVALGYALATVGLRP